ncbi:hypothetical protein Tco_1072880 [Tanacetum coccineum]
MRRSRTKFHRYGYDKNHKKIVKNGQTRIRERKSVQEPEAKGKTRGFSKLKVQKSNSRVQDQDGKINTSSEVLIGGNPQGECHVNMKKAQRMGIFTLGSLS